MTTSNTNFIQRNREQVQPKSELTEEEKARIEHLLKEDNKTPSKQDQQQTGVNKVDSDAAARMKSIDAKLKVFPLILWVKSLFIFKGHDATAFE